MSNEEYIPAEYQLEGKHFEAVLGPLETRVMQTIWQMKTPVRVREVYEKLRNERKIAYTTVMTTMNTLFEKGLLDRKVGKGRGGLLYLYWPKHRKEDIEKSVVKHVIKSLMENFGDSVTAYLMEFATSDDEKMKTFKKLFEQQLDRENE